MSQVYEWGCFYDFQEGINFVSYTIFWMNRMKTNLRNIAIIAHVDHGKTTLVDKLLATALGKSEDGET